MQAAKLAQRSVVQRLQSDRDAIDAGEPIAAEPTRFDTGGIGFERDLDIPRNLPVLRNSIKNCRNRGRLHEGWRAAAEKDRGDYPIGSARRRRRDLGRKSAHEALLI